MPRSAISTDTAPLRRAVLQHSLPSPRKEIPLDKRCVVIAKTTGKRCKNLATYGTLCGTHHFMKTD